MRIESRRGFLQGSAALASLSLLAGCGMLPTSGQRPARRAWIGFLAPDAPESNPTSATMNEAFREALRDLGYVEGQTITIEWKLAENGDALMPAFAADLVRSQPAVIVVRGEIAARAARDATSTIPIVIALASDPVGAGLVASLARPGGNVTGLVNISPLLSAKRLELLTQAAPGLSRIAAFTNQSEQARVNDFRETEAAARTLGLRLQALEVRGPGDFEAAFAAAVAERAEGLVVFAGPLNSSQRLRIIDFATRQRLPSIFALREHAGAGGLLAYGPSYRDLHRRAATYVDKILKGSKPADLPIEQPTVFDLVINLKTAGALGLTIPSSVLQQATEVIQ